MATRHIAGKVALVTGSTSGIGFGIAKVIKTIRCVLQPQGGFAAKRQLMCERVGSQVLASQGCNILLNGFGEEVVIQQAISSIREEHNVNVEYHAADLTKKQEIQDMFAFTRSTLGEVDILVNNAGTLSSSGNKFQKIQCDLCDLLGAQYVANVEEFPDDKWDFLISLNLTSNFHTIKEALPHMKRSGYGRIINISSAHGKVASAGKVMK